MTNAAYRIEKNTDAESPQEFILRFVDSNGEISPPLAALETTMGVHYSLVPHPEKPWLKIETCEDMSLRGRPVRQGNVGEPFRTGDIRDVYAAQDKKIEAMPHFRPEPARPDPFAAARLPKSSLENN